MMPSQSLFRVHFQSQDGQVGVGERSDPLSVHDERVTCGAAANDTTDDGRRVVHRQRNVVRAQPR